MIDEPDVVLRPWRGVTDLAGMCALRNARVARDGLGEFATVERMQLQYEHLRNCDPDADIIVAERDGTIVGYARTTWDDVIEGDREHWLVIEAGGDHVGLEAYLIEWSEQRAREVAADHPSPTSFMVAEAGLGSERESRLTAIGFVPLRYDATLVRPHLDEIPARSLPDGVEIRPVADADLRAVFDADVDAFRDARGFVEPTDEDWDAFRDTARHGATDLWQVAWAGDEVVGQVRTYVNEGEAASCGRRRAWTESISTDRAWRGRGVATAVICASLRQLAGLGFEEAALGADTESPTGAFTLYRSLGYRVVATDVFLRRPI